MYESGQYLRRGCLPPHWAVSYYLDPLRLPVAAAGVSLQCPSVDLNCTAKCGNQVGCLESPVQGLTRFAAHDVELAGVAIPPGRP
jgi:hypothetical protein